MNALKYRYWRDGNWLLGFLLGHPEYVAQGDSIEDLCAQLVDLQAEIDCGNLP